MGIQTTTVSKQVQAEFAELCQIPWQDYCQMVLDDALEQLVIESRRAGIEPDENEQIAQLVTTYHA